MHTLDELPFAPSDALVYKVLRGGELAVLAAEGAFAGSPADVLDGFVHLSTAAQLAGTLAKHFADDEGLFLVGCRKATMADALRWEPSRRGALFPHLYRALAVADVAVIVPLADDPAGRLRLAAALAHATLAGATLAGATLAGSG